MIRLLTISLIALTGLSSCHIREREEALAKREQALAEKERLFTAHDADYWALVKMRDSLLAAADTMVVQMTWPDTLAGSWSSKIVCTESNCNDYVIGDQKKETWKFMNDSTGIFVQAYSKEKLIRTYNARYDSNSVVLQYTPDSSSAKKSDISVALSNFLPGVTKGMQMIRSDNCNAGFTVELVRSSKK